MAKSSTQHDRQRLRDIVEASDAIADFVADSADAGFEEDDLVRSAVLYKLVIIGEAAARLSESAVEHHSHVPWADIVGLRNIVVHQYFGVSWDRVWVTATVEVPKLREQVAQILKAEWPADPEGLSDS